MEDVMSEFNIVNQLMNDNGRYRAARAAKNSNILKRGSMECVCVWVRVNFLDQEHRSLHKSRSQRKGLAAEGRRDPSGLNIATP